MHILIKLIHFGTFFYTGMQFPWTIFCIHKLIIIMIVELHTYM